MLDDGWLAWTTTTLNNPLLVAAFEGWNDAGNAASSAADCSSATAARNGLRIESDQYIDYQSHRPRLELIAGVARAIAWPTNECFAAAFSERDIVVLRGSNPTFAGSRSAMR